MIDLHDLAEKAKTMKMQCTMEERLAIIKALNFAALVSSEAMEYYGEDYYDIDGGNK